MSHDVTSLYCMRDPRSNRLHFYDVMTQFLQWCNFVFEVRDIVVAFLVNNGHLLIATVALQKAKAYDVNHSLFAAMTMLTRSPQSAVFKWRHDPDLAQKNVICCYTKLPSHRHRAHLSGLDRMHDQCMSAKLQQIKGKCQPCCSSLNMLKQFSRNLADMKEAVQNCIISVWPSLWRHFHLSIVAACLHDVPWLTHVCTEAKQCELS